MNETIYALGFFDGVHVGHAALLSACRTLAAEHGCAAGVVTFAAHPDTLVLGSTPGLINSIPDREWMLREKFQMDTVITLPFDRQMRAMPWRDFLEMLCRDYCAAGFVCGEDFRFGSMGEGSAALLSRFCGDAGLLCAVIPEQSIDGIRVSSTYIRTQIETGDMQTAVKFLGHPYFLRGRVVHGRGLGRRLGIPTANLQLPGELAVPEFGVYAGRAIAMGKACPAVTNIGICPTVDGSHVSVQTWLLDFAGDLYGCSLTLELYRFLRPEQTFPTLEALKDEVRRNAEQTRRLIRSVQPDGRENGFK